MTDYLEGALSRVDRRRLEKHLARCHGCTQYLAQIRATIAIAGRVTPDDLTEHMHIEFADLYRRWQRDRETEDQGLVKRRHSLVSGRCLPAADGQDARHEERPGHPAGGLQQRDHGPCTAGQGPDEACRGGHRVSAVCASRRWTRRF